MAPMSKTKKTAPTMRMMMTQIGGPSAEAPSSDALVAGGSTGVPPSGIPVVPVVPVVPVDTAVVPVVPEPVVPVVSAGQNEKTWSRGGAPPLSE